MRSPFFSRCQRFLLISAKFSLAFGLVLFLSVVVAPQEVEAQNTAIAISSSYHHSCALLDSGQVECWGGNAGGQLGNGNTTPSTTPVTVSNITNAVAISTGSAHSCAVLSTGLVKCWGGNGDGQLGNGNTTPSTTPVTVSNITNAIAISSSDYSTCAVLGTGSVKCWGFGIPLQLGTGTTNSSTTPVTVSNITNAVAVSIGGASTCAALSTGTVQCWGANTVGQLGNGTTDYSTTPVTVDNITNAVAVSVGSKHSCAVLSTGTVQCWGGNPLGELGNGIKYGAWNNTPTTTPVTVSNITNAIAISSRGGRTCAVLGGGTVQCWGVDLERYPGKPISTGTATPVTVSNISNTVAVATSEGHTCGVLSTGAAQCWGFNENGQLGDGTTTDSSTPVTVVELDGTGSTPTPTPSPSATPTPTPTNAPPTIPTELGQLNDTNSLAIPTGINNHIGTTAAENTVVFSGYVSDPDGDQAQLQVEVRKVGEAFDDTDDETTDFLISPLVDSGELATTAVFNATPGDYYWRARTIDINGNKGEWVEFGDNPTDETDFDYGFEPHPYGFPDGNFTVEKDTLSGGVSKKYGFFGEKSIVEGDLWEIFRQTFDLSNIEGNEARLIENFELVDLDDHISGGACYGMVAAAAIQYQSPEYLEIHYPEFAAAITNGSPAVLSSSPINVGASPVSDASRIMQPIPQTVASLLSSWHGSRVRMSLNTSQSEGWTNNPVNILRFLEEEIYATNAFPNNSQFVIYISDETQGAHAVVPYKVKGNLIYVYDPNDPDSNQDEATGDYIGDVRDPAYDNVIVVDRENNTWSYVFSKFADDQSKNVVWEPGDADDTIYLAMLPVSVLTSEGLPTLVDQNVDAVNHIDGPANMMLIDDAGRRTGYDQHGDYFAEIPGSFVLPPAPLQLEAGEMQYPGRVMTVPATTNYTVEVSGVEDGYYSVTVLKPGYLAEFAEIETGDGVVDEIVVEASTVAIQFDGNRSTEGGNYNILYVNDEGSEDIVFAGGGVPLNAGSIQSFAVDWVGIENGEEGVTLEIDEDGDGTIDQTIVSDADLTGVEITDTTPPTTTLTLDGNEVPDFGYLPGATVTLSATDNEGGSGVATTEYSLDDGATWTPYTAPIVFDTVGEYTLLYRSTDNAGNIEADESETFVIALAPTPTPEPTPTSTPEPTPLPNLLTNAGFETDTDWQKGFWTSSKGTITRVTSTKHSGSYSYMIDGDTSSSGGQVYSDNANRVPVTPGTRYEYSAWYKGNNAYLVIKWFNSSGTELSSARNNFGLENTSAWTEAVKEAIAPTGATTAWVFVQSRSNSSPVYFDDLEFFPLDESTPSTLTNPSFETQDGWLKGFWTSSKGTIARVTSTKHSGSYSYMIDGDTNSSGGQVYSDTANLLAVTPGQDYRFSAWYQGKNIYLVIKWLDANGNELTSKRNNIWQPNSTSWKQATATVTAPLGATKAWLFVQTRDNAEPAYFDDIGFEVAQ